MAKISSILGKATGKVSSVVLIPRTGAVLARAYNPKKTQNGSEGQFIARAKLKLAGQIAAALAPAILIPPQGKKTTRNLFIKRNYNLISFENDIASIDYSKIQLTNGNIGIPSLIATRTIGTGISVQLTEEFEILVNRVVYYLYTKTENGKLLYMGSKVVNDAGENKRFPATFPYINGDICIFAFGMVDVTTNATQKYGDATIQTGFDVASLFMKRFKAKKEVFFTRTTGVTMYAGSSRSDVDTNLLVDMGLPSGTLWAKSNIDVTTANKLAASPFQYDCSFFSWGNVDGHNPISNTRFDYNWGGINAEEPWYEGQPYGSTPGAQLTTDIPVSAKYDAARANLGAPWQMPTTNDFSELINNCIYIDADGNEISSDTTDKLIKVNGIQGIYLQSKINGARLFFACSGRGIEYNWYGIPNVGIYNSCKIQSKANSEVLYINNKTVRFNYPYQRQNGLPIRPIVPPKS